VRAGLDHSHVAVIIVGWNNESLLVECVESVRAQTFPKDRLATYVVDNGSTDGSVGLLSSMGDVELLDVGWNSGFATANNIAIRTAIDDPLVDYVVLLNSDARLASNWIETIVNFASTRPRGAAFQTITLDHRSPHIVDSHHLYLDQRLQARQAHQGDTYTDQFVSQRVFGCNAAAAMYTRAFIEAQPFPEFLDERMFMYLEDVDVAARALVMGWENWFVAGSYATHVGSATTKTRSNGFALEQTWRNQPVLLITNFGWPTLRTRLFGLAQSERLAIRHLRHTQASGELLALWRGRVKGLGLVPYALSRRRILRSHRRFDDTEVELFMTTGTLHR
jgi:GT2 family glycosyltransferase